MHIERIKTHFKEHQLESNVPLVFCIIAKCLYYPNPNSDEFHLLPSEKLVKWQPMAHFETMF